MGKEKIFILFFAIWGICGGNAFSSTPDFLEVKNRALSSEGRLLDRDGHLLQTRRVEARWRQLAWVPLSEVSPALIDALTFVEDRRFYQHSGVDWISFGSSLWHGIQGKNLRGASTLTMQLLKFIEEREGLTRHRSRRLWEKVRQMRRASELESHWSKEEILEAYLNLVTFRGDLRGIQASSRAIFGKEPHGLDTKESFFLASLLKSPNASPPQLAERLCLFTREKAELGSCSELKEFVGKIIEKTYSPLHSQRFAFHLARDLVSRDHVQVNSTLLIHLQRVAQDSLDRQLSDLQSQNVRDGAVVVLENRTGKILAYVGGSEFSEAPQVDMAKAPRQVGSTLKPFLYALAFEKKIIGPNSWLDDSPYDASVGLGVYHPENYNEKYLGPVKAKIALGSSLNIPAVRTLDLVGVNSFYDSLKKNGIKGLMEPEYYGSSLALGAADVDLLTLTNAYRTLARNGVWSEVSAETKELHSSKRVYTAKSARLISGLLADPENRVFTFGWDSILSTPYGASVKTGTSKDMRDNWCIGFTKEYTVGVWVGNATGVPMWQVSGISGAAPVWRAMMDSLYARALPKGKPVKEKILFPETEIVKNFIPRIKYPVDGSVLALDPEIPSNRQMVPIEVLGDGLRVFMDNSELKEVFWKPALGHHHLQLRSSAGEVLDQVNFLVRD